MSHPGSGHVLPCLPKYRVLPTVFENGPRKCQTRRHDSGTLNCSHKANWFPIDSKARNF